MSPPPEFDLFVVHAEADRAWVDGYLKPMLGLEPARVFTPRDFGLGAVVAAEFERGVTSSRYTLLVLSPAFLADRWTEFGEGLVAFSSVDEGRNRLLALTLHPCQAPLRLRFRESLDYTDWTRWDDESARLRHHLDAPEPTVEVVACPYPGMVPFRKEDARFFHGRDLEIQNLLTLVRQHHFLAVIGSSGSGKSSLIAAGLLPRLDDLRNFPRGTWRVLSLRPGATPMEELGRVLDGVALNPAEAISRSLAVDPPAQRLLLIVDQFEELFSQVKAATTRDAFIIHLKALRADPRCVVLLTMRADFYGDLMNSALWPIDKSQIVPVAALRGDVLRQAIVKPAEAVGIYLEERLLDRLVADAANEPGALPMLQEALVLLWGTMSGRLITRTSYERLGHDGRSGLAVAMATKADATLAGLPQDEQKIARRVFLRLVQFGEGRPDTRRRLAEADLRAAGDDPAVFRHVMATLVDNRLLTPSPEDARGRRYDIAHEMLIVGWPASAEWVQARREAEKTRRRLVAKAEEWARLGRGAGGLLDTAELFEADHWLSAPDAAELGVDAGVRDLAAASRAALDAQAARDRRRVRNTITGLAAGLVVCAVLAVWALAEAKRARDAADREALSHRSENCTHLMGTPRPLADWSEDKLNQLDGDIAWVAARDPGIGARLRTDRTNALSAAVRDALTTETLDERSRAEVNRVIMSLEGYDGAAAVAGLRAQLDDRLRRWEMLFDLVGPGFRDLGTRFDLSDVRVNRDVIESQRPAEEPGALPLVKARDAFAGSLRLRATFDPSWASGTEVGLVLDTPRGDGYRFLLMSRAPGAADDDEPPTFEALRRRREPMWVRLFRDKTRLREASLQVPEGDLQVVATRADEALSLTLNQKEVIAYEDPFPVGGGVPVRLGVVLPHGVGIRRLAAERQGQPNVPIAMDRGDALYTQGKYADALREFEAQGRASAGKPAEAEALFKQALCLQEISDRKDDAVAILDRLTDGLNGARGAASRWPLRAACRLWLLHLKRSKTSRNPAQDRDRAEQVLNRLTPGYSFEDLAALVPAEDREQILANYSLTWGGEYNLLVYHTGDGEVELLRRAVRLVEVLGEGADQRQSMALRLVDALRVVDRVGEARQVAEEQLNRGGLLPRYRVQLLRDVAWMLTEAGKPGEALETLDRALAADGEALPMALLLVDRARVKAVKGDLGGAEADLDAFLARAPADRLEYAEYADACLLLGLVRDRRGDHDGALHAWRQGLPPDWADRLPRLAPGRPLLWGLGPRLRGESVIFHGQLLSLRGEMTDDEARDHYNVTIAPATVTHAAKSEVSDLASNRPVPSGLVRAIILKTYTTPEARDFLWRMTTHQVPLPVFLQEPFELTIHAAIALTAVDRDHSFKPGGLSPETDATTRKAVRLLFSQYKRSQITNFDVTRIAVAWLGLSNLESTWTSLAPRLDPELAPLLAYGFGRGCLALDRERSLIRLIRGDASAAELFHAAVVGAPAGSLVWRLAQDELQHLAKTAPAR
jgi:tetratricopeptide (TPR) repeat protein